jgi:SAM-dependent methyltransferase
VSRELGQLFGGIDIYLFDQLLRGRFDDRPRILDAGSGGGRNLPYFVARGFEICAIDNDAAAVAALQRAWPSIDARHGELTALPWGDRTMDAVICSAVLHFARDRDHFEAMVKELWRVLRDGGLFFARLASSIGIEALLPAPTGRVRLPDGSDRFIVCEQILLDLTRDLHGSLLDPIKSTNVQGQRVMTTWVLEKSTSHA